jgi:hypothetical protein
VLLNIFDVYVLKARRLKGIRPRHDVKVFIKKALNMALKGNPS